MPAMLASTSDAPSNPHGVNVGAAAASLAHVPTWPARLHRIDGSVQAVLQQTPLAQKSPVTHREDVVQVPATPPRVQRRLREHMNEPVCEVSVHSPCSRLPQDARVKTQSLE
jgi:hypothetical protein